MQRVFGQSAAWAEGFVVRVCADKHERGHGASLSRIVWKLVTIIDMIRPDTRFGRFITSPLGKLILGAGLGGLIVAFANIQDPVVFFAGMVIGVVVVFALGRIR